MTNKEIIDEAYHLGMLQNPYEIENALEFVKKLKVKNFMEIGTDQGGTFVCWSRVSDPDGLRVSVDWAHGPWGVNNFDIQARNNKLFSLGSNVHILDGDSHAESMYNSVKSIIGDNVYIFDQPDFYFKVIQNVNATVDNIFTNGSSFTTAFDLSFSS